MEPLDYFSPIPVVPTGYDRGSLLQVAKCHLFFGGMGLLGVAMLWPTLTNDPKLYGLPTTMMIAFGLFFASGLCLLYRSLLIIDFEAKANQVKQ